MRLTALSCLLMGLCAAAAQAEPAIRVDSNTGPNPLILAQAKEPSMTSPLNLNWSPANQQAIDALFKNDLKGQVAVFDADQTLWRDDVGEGFLHWLIDNQHLVKAAPGGDAFAHYEALCQQSKTIGYAYAAQAMAGIPEARLQALAAAYFKDHFQQNIYPAQKALIARLQQAGVEVWMVSASNQWIVDAGAPYLGVPLNRVVGIRLAVDSAGLITETVVPPVTYRQGKVDAILKYIGQQPILVSGDSMTDYEMLVYAKQLRLVINPAERGVSGGNITDLAQEHGWHIQRW